MTRVVSFSYKFGPKPVAAGLVGGRLVLDARCVDNPYVHGTPDEEMRRTVLTSPKAQALIERGLQFLRDVPDGILFVGCSYGRHRSVAIADEIARRFGTHATHTSKGSNGKPS